MKKSTKFLDFICFVVGPLVSLLFLFSFKHYGRGVSGSLYYPAESIIGIAIGVALVCLGFLRVYWRKNVLPNRDVEEEKNKERREVTRKPEMETKGEQKPKGYFKNEEYKHCVLECFDTMNTDTLKLTQITMPIRIAVLDRDSVHWTLLALDELLNEGKLEEVGKDTYRLKRAKERKEEGKKESKKRTATFY